jgi:hypothetical protein
MQLPMNFNNVLVIYGYLLVAVYTPHIQFYGVYAGRCTFYSTD